MKAETAYNVYLGLLEIMPEEEVKRFQQKIGVIASEKRRKDKIDENREIARIQESIIARFLKRRG